MTAQETLDFIRAYGLWVEAGEYQWLIDIARRDRRRER